MSFNDIRDQAVSLRLLRQIIKRGRIPHGLLFWGPDGVGKRLAALEFAKALNCTELEEDACDACLACRKVSHGNHPDVKIIAPAGKTRIIKVETIDEISDMTAYAPFEGGWRVFIILNVERMSEDSQNHFLKTLEEPASKTLFILITEQPGRLLPTIRSRCQLVRFGALSPETVVDLLCRETALKPEAAQAIAALSQGQMARALDLVETEKRDVVVGLLQRLASGEDPLLLSQEFSSHLDERKAAMISDINARMAESGEDRSREDTEALQKEIEAMTEGLLRREVMEYLRLMQTWYRDELVLGATGDTAQVLNADLATSMRPGPGAGALERITAIDKAWLYIERNLRKDKVYRDLFFTLAS